MKKQILLLAMSLLLSIGAFAQSYIHFNYTHPGTDCSADLAFIVYTSDGGISDPYPVFYNGGSIMSLYYGNFTWSSTPTSSSLDYVQKVYVYNCAGSAGPGPSLTFCPVTDGVEIPWGNVGQLTNECFEYSTGCTSCSTGQIINAHTIWSYAIGGIHWEFTLDN